MKGKLVYVVSYNAGVLGVYTNTNDAARAKAEYKEADYKGLRIEVFPIR